MKVERFKPETKQRFEPIGINVTFESKDELLVFWALLNTSLTKLRTNAGGYVDVIAAIERNDAKEYDGDVIMALFNLIDEIVESLCGKKMR